MRREDRQGTCIVCVRNTGYVVKEEPEFMSRGGYKRTEWRIKSNDVPNGGLFPEVPKRPDFVEEWVDVGELDNSSKQIGNKDLIIFICDIKP